MIRILVVDDHQILRMGLAIFFETCDDMEMIGEAEDGRQAVELCGVLLPDVVLMDVHMPVMDGISATRMIVQQFPHIRVLILTYSLGVDPVERGLQAGAQAVLRKTVSIDVLAEAIRTAVA
jgi:two-component system, NarL family, response regulator LiaR